MGMVCCLQLTTPILHLTALYCQHTVTPIEKTGAVRYSGFEKERSLWEKSLRWIISERITKT
jgi:hypothetical protein